MKTLPHAQIHDQMQHFDEMYLHYGIYCNKSVQI